MVLFKERVYVVMEYDASAMQYKLQVMNGTEQISASAEALLYGNEYERIPT